MSNVRNTPQPIATVGGTDNQGPDITNVGQQFPNSVDALPGMQFPDLPGGPDVNAPRSPFATAHPATTPLAPVATDYGLPAYGSIPQPVYQVTPEE